MDIRTLLVDTVFEEARDKQIPVPESKSIDAKLMNDVQARLEFGRDITVELTKGEETMTIEEFINQLDAGRITDFSPFLEKTYSEHFRADMVKRGIQVHEALVYNEELPVVEAIRANIMEECYEQWSTHNSPNVREKLAKRGYFPEVFIHDEKPAVRSAVFFAHPHLAEELLSDVLTYLRAWETIKFSKQVSTGVLKAFLDTPRHPNVDNVYLSYVRRKYEAMTITPTSLEATMSFKQLFLANNPLWAKDLTVDEQMRLMKRVRENGREFVAENLEEYITIPN